MVEATGNPRIVRPTAANVDAGAEDTLGAGTRSAAGATMRFGEPAPDAGGTAGNAGPEEGVCVVAGSPPAVDAVERAVVAGSETGVEDDVVAGGSVAADVVTGGVVVSDVVAGSVVVEPVRGAVVSGSAGEASSSDESAAGVGVAVVVGPIDGTDEGEVEDGPPPSPTVGRADGSADVSAEADDVDSSAPVVSATATPCPANSAAPTPTAAAPDRIHTVIECFCVAPMRRSRDRRADFAARAFAFARFRTR
ncbi:hypothetical protein [uncultured Williamsia sp.]|uniref:hypothetical protein n=1 Tax=uncultured Williamsia sp. TaxID=259311 RepID=UPI00263902E6|nr:hypothetical protein [uncultured Williamsia sp.]